MSFKGFVKAWVSRLTMSLSSMILSHAENWMRKLLGSCLALCICLGVMLATCLGLMRILLHHVIEI